MDTLSGDRAGKLLGGALDGHDVVAGHANRNGLTLLATPHRWPGQMQQSGASQ